MLSSHSFVFQHLLISFFPHYSLFGDEGKTKQNPTLQKEMCVPWGR